ncbi:MAG TPA: helix-turn-helix domain-containing protein, partial [Ktedonobacterales bacterium]|nr:helix-turn-helix domain-containing protein [Ktedonobacterales bacterium]
MRSDDADDADDADDVNEASGARRRLDAPPEDERGRHAVALYLQGRRVAEVAAALEVSETTVRRWARRALTSLAADERAERATQLQRAIESQRAVASAAWEAYERERQLDEALLRGELDHVRRRAIRGQRTTSAD